MYKYSIIGGNPYTSYTGTTSFTSLRVIGQANTQDEIEAIVKEKFDECRALMLVIDLETGKEANLSCGF